MNVLFLTRDRYLYSRKSYHWGQHPAPGTPQRTLTGRRTAADTAPEPRVRANRPVRYSAMGAMLVLAAGALLCTACSQNVPPHSNPTGG